MSQTVDIEVTELSPEARPCRVAASPSGLMFRRGDAEHFFDAAALRKMVQLNIGLLLRPSLVAKLDGKRTQFRLERDALPALFHGLGRELATSWVLWYRVKWFIPIALLFVVTSIPIPGDAEAGLEPIPFDALGMALGGGLIGISVLARFKPTAWLLLADALWLGALIVQGVYSIALGTDHPAWLIVQAMLFLLLVSGLRTYRQLVAVPLAG